MTASRMINLRKPFGKAPEQARNISLYRSQRQSSDIGTRAGAKEQDKIS
jgi:hypothetical protein